MNSYPIHDRNNNTVIEDPTCIWFKNLQKNPTKKKTYIEFKTSTYTISNWTGDLFPHTINICIDGFAGYLGIDSIPT